MTQELTVYESFFFFFFLTICVPWVALLKPRKAFLEATAWFKQRKTRKKVAPSLTPLDAVRAAGQQTGKKNKHLGNHRCQASTRARDWSLRYGAVCRFTDLHFVSLLSLLCMHVIGNTAVNEDSGSGKFCLLSLSPLSLSLSLSLSLYHGSRKKNHFHSTRQSVHPSKNSPSFSSTLFFLPWTCRSCKARTSSVSLLRNCEHEGRGSGVDWPAPRYRSM